MKMRIDYHDKFRGGAAAGDARAGETCARVRAGAEAARAGKNAGVSDQWLDMHSKDARALGETEQRLYALNAWRETPFYSERERAALEWTEAVTLLSDTHVPDEVYEQVRKHFSEKELLDLTFAVVAINSCKLGNISAEEVVCGGVVKNRGNWSTESRWPGIKQIPHIRRPLRLPGPTREEASPVPFGLTMARQAKGQRRRNKAASSRRRRQRDGGRRHSVEWMGIQQTDRP